MKFVDKDRVPNFANVTEFATWYFLAGMPLLLPEKPEVFVSDDATSTCLFRHGRFQFEIYLIHPNPVIPQHEHPGVSNVEISQDTLQHISTGDLFNFVQKDGVVHGAGFRERASHSGFALMSAQMWSEGLEMSTIGARWKGHTAGPKHEALIRRFNPDCLVYPGYADVTQKAVVSEIL
jgi:hypothetical protein